MITSIYTTINPAVVDLMRSLGSAVINQLQNAALWKSIPPDRILPSSPAPGDLKTAVCCFLPPAYGRSIYCGQGLMPQNVLPPAYRRNDWALIRVVSVPYLLPAYGRNILCGNVFGDRDFLPPAYGRNADHKKFPGQRDFLPPACGRN